MQVRVAEQHILALHDGRVEMARTQASPGDEKHARILGDAECGTALDARCGEHACAHGVAGEHDMAFVGKRPSGMVVGQAHGACPARQVLVRHAHDRVLLVDHHGDAALLGGAGDRDAYVAAETHHAVGMYLGKPLARQLRGTLDLHDGLGKRERMIAVEARGLEGFVRDARRGDEARLDAAGRAGEQHLMPAFAQHIGKREGRIDMAGGTAAGKDYAHDVTSGMKNAFDGAAHLAGRACANRPCRRAVRCGSR